MLSCAPAAERLPELFSDSARAGAQPGSWQSNRRFYLLADYFSRQGFARCLPYRTVGDCSSFPRMEQQSFPRLGQIIPEKILPQTRINFIKNLVLEPSASPKATYILDYTGTVAGGYTAEKTRELLGCLAANAKFIAVMPRIVFAEGPEGIAQAVRKYPKVRLADAAQKKCFLPEEKL